MSYKLYLFCVETTRQCNSDWIYIRKAIDFLLPYKDLYGIFRPIYLETKYKYNDKGIIKQIKEEKNEFAGECEVIYCIDLDDYSIKSEDYNKFCEIEKYCKDNGYHLAYFSRTIEEVFIGKKIHSSDKKIEAAKYLKNGEITKDLANRLNKTTKSLKTSNILEILTRIADIEEE